MLFPIDLLSVSCDIYNIILETTYEEAKVPIKKFTVHLFHTKYSSNSLTIFNDISLKTY